MIILMKLWIPFEKAKEIFAAIPTGYNWDKNFDLSKKYKNRIMPWTVFRLYFKSSVKKTQKQIKKFWNDIFYISWEVFDKAYKDLHIDDTEGKDYAYYRHTLEGTYDTDQRKVGRELSQQRYNRIMRGLKSPENKESIVPFINKKGVDLSLLPEEENKVDSGVSDDQDDDNNSDGNNEPEENAGMSGNMLGPGQDPESFGTAEKRKYGSKLRKKLLEKENSKCQLCSIDILNLLVTSHIKDYKKSSRDEKYNTNNVLLLCAIHDKLFDRGFITFNDTGSIMISKQLKGVGYFNLLNIDTDSKIKMNRERIECMEWHRNNKFKK